MTGHNKQQKEPLKQELEEKGTQGLIEQAENREVKNEPSNPSFT